MKKKKKKEFQKIQGKKAINYYLRAIEDNYFPSFSPYYAKEIMELSKSLVIRLSREEKLLFCRKCYTPMNVSTRKIRLNQDKKTKEYICLICGHRRKFRYL